MRKGSLASGLGICLGKAKRIDDWVQGFVVSVEKGVKPADGFWVLCFPLCAYYARKKRALIRWDVRSLPVGAAQTALEDLMRTSNEAPTELFSAQTGARTHARVTNRPRIVLICLTHDFICRSRTRFQINFPTLVTRSGENPPQNCSVAHC